MTVPRHIKRARRAMIEPAVVDRPWLVDALLPAIVIGLILWCGGLAGLIAIAGVR